AGRAAIRGVGQARAGGGVEVEAWIGRPARRRVRLTLSRRPQRARIGTRPRWGRGRIGRFALSAAATIGAGLATSPVLTPAGETSPPPRVPPGFVVDESAVGGAVRLPRFATHDDRGRLFVAESSGRDLYAEMAAGTPIRLRPASNAI